MDWTVVVAPLGGRPAITLTPGSESVSFSTQAFGGFGSCTFRVPLAQIQGGIGRIPKLAHVALYLGDAFLWEGRIEDHDVDYIAETVTVTGFGYQRLLDDVSVRGIWINRAIGWQLVTDVTGSGKNYKPKTWFASAVGRFDSDDLSRQGIILSAQTNEAASTGDAHGAWYFSEAGLSRLKFDEIKVMNDPINVLVQDSPNGTAWTTRSDHSPSTTKTARSIALGQTARFVRILAYFTSNVTGANVAVELDNMRFLGRMMLTSSTTTTRACTLVDASTTVTLTSGTTTGLSAGMSVEGTGVQPGTVISSITDATHFVMSQAAELGIDYRVTSVPDSETLWGFDPSGISVGMTVGPETNTNGDQIYGSSSPWQATVTSVGEGSVSISPATRHVTFWDGGGPGGTVNTTFSATGAQTLTFSTSSEVDEDLGGINQGSYYPAKLVANVALHAGLETGVIHEDTSFTIPQLARTNRDKFRSVLEEISSYYVRRWGVWEDSKLDWRIPNFDEVHWILPLEKLIACVIQSSVDNTVKDVYLSYQNAGSGLAEERSASATDQRNPWVKSGATKDEILQAPVAMTALSGQQLANRIRDDHGSTPSVRGRVGISPWELVENAVGAARPACMIRAGQNVLIPQLPKDDYLRPGRDAQTLFHVTATSTDMAEDVTSLELEGYTRTADILISRIASVTRMLTG